MSSHLALTVCEQCRSESLNQSRFGRRVQDMPVKIGVGMGDRRVEEETALVCTCSLESQRVSCFVSKSLRRRREEWCS